MTSSPKLVFFGNERLATGVTTDTPVLRGLIQAGYDVCAVVANYHEAASRKERELEIAAVAREHHIPFLLPDKPIDVYEELARYQAEVGVLVAYGKVVPQSVIDLFPHGIINLHPSLLPRHRGSIPIEAVILEGAAKTGVTVMQLVSAMDAGPVYAQKELLLTGRESKQGLSDKLVKLGGDLILEILPRILGGEAEAITQDATKATVDRRIIKADGQVDWTKPAAQLEREIRAYLGWPGSKTTVFEREVTILAAHVDNSTALPFIKAESFVGKPFRTPSGELAVTCGQDTTLVIDRLTPAGKREMTGPEFLAGHHL